MFSAGMYNVSRFIPFLLLLLSCHRRPGLPPPEADFVFRGRLEILQSSTLEEEEDADSLAVVKMERIFRTPPGVPITWDSLITVRLANPKAARPGDSRVFFAKLYRVGEGMGAVELHALGGKTVLDDGSVSRILRRGDSVRAFAAARGRMKSAERVVRAKVVAILEPGLRDPPYSRGWVEVRLAVAESFKGIPADTLTALYGFEVEEARLLPGSEWIFLLAGFPAQKPARYAILDRIPADTDIRPYLEPRR